MSEPRITDTPKQKPRAARKEAAQITNTLIELTDSFFKFVENRPDRADEPSVELYLSLNRKWIVFCHRKWRHHDMPKLNAFENNIKARLAEMKAYEDTLQKQDESGPERGVGLTD